MNRQYSSRSLTGRRSYSSPSAISTGFRDGIRSGGYTSISHYNIGRSRKLSGGGLSGYSSAGYSTGGRECGADLGSGRSGGFSSVSTGGHSRIGGYSSRSHGGVNGRHGGFSSRSLGGGYSRSYRISGFGSQSLGSSFFSRGAVASDGETLGRYGVTGGIHGVRVNASLLRPLCIQVDPEISRVKEEERDQIKTLNDQFAGFIDKVRHLEQQNKLLETKWTCLQQTEPDQKNIEPMFDNYIATLNRQLGVLLNEREQLQSEQTKFQDLVEEYKSSYEEEINRRVGSENQFVDLKKDVDGAYASKVELEVKLETLRQDLDFFRCFYETELEILNSMTYDTSVIVSMDNSRDFDMEGIIAAVKNQYEEIAQRSKDEVNILYATKYQELQDTWGRHCTNVTTSRQEIQDLTSLIKRFKADMENAKKQVDALQTSIAETEERGECALKDAKAKHAEVEQAMQTAKDELARLLRDYQELLNVKMALDIEIATYKTLLEGEENRLCNSTSVNISVTGRSPHDGRIRGDGFGVRTEYGSSSGGTPRNARHHRTGYSSRSGGIPSRSSAEHSSIRSSGDSPRSRGYSSRSGGHGSHRARISSVDDPSGTSRDIRRSSSREGRAIDPTRGGSHGYSYGGSRSADSRDATRDVRDARDARDARDSRDARDARDVRDARDARDARADRRDVSGSRIVHGGHCSIIR